MPFWDDVNPSALPELSSKLIMIDAFAKPTRFRFTSGVVGEDVKGAYGGDLAGKFLDETEVRQPLQFLLSQCSATVEGRAPTYYHHAAGGSGSSHAGRAYSRLILPLWGEGRIGMLLGALAWE